MKRLFLYIVHIIALMAFISSCQQEEDFLNEDGNGKEYAYITYNVSMGSPMQTRAIGDGSKVDQLKVGVFRIDQDGNRTLMKIHEFSDNGDGAKDGKFSNVTFPLLKKDNYDIVFWAQNEGNKVYSIDEDDFTVSIDYDEYNGVSLETAETFEAFYARLESVDYTKTGRNVTLTRPFAQVNIGASEEEDKDKIKKSVVTVKSGYIYSKFNPLTDEKTGENTNEVSFVYTDLKTEDGDHIASGSDKYYYLATAFILPCNEKVEFTVQLLDEDEQLVKEIDKTGEKAVPVKANSKTNITGDVITQEELAPWDGITFADFSDEELECEVYSISGVQGNILHIDTPAELAKFLRYGMPAGYVAVHICKNLDMGGWDFNSLPNGESISLKGISGFNGDVVIDGSSSDPNASNHIVSWLVAKGNKATGVFGNADNEGDITVQNLALYHITIENSANAVGAVFGTVKGNATFSNVAVSNSSINGVSGNAGGMVGKIVRYTENNRAETLNANFSECTVNATTVTGGNTGKFVGVFSGYDNAEVLTFTDCSSDIDDIGMKSSYIDGKKAQWLDDVDFSDYNAFLGNETYHRGIVKFGEDRFVLKWDGKTTVEPLLANKTYDGDNISAASNRYVVYSPFDLAGIRKKTASPAAIYLKADVDMNGQGADGKYNVPSNFTQSAYSSTDDNVFDPFSYVTTLDGYINEDCIASVYNLSISQIEQDKAAFVLYASGTTVHKNVNFRNCCTVAVHKPVSTDAKAYGAILVANVDATYTMENVHAWDCKVFALQKVGTLGARISGTSTLKNNSVNNCYVENYECEISERFESGAKEMYGVKIKNVYADFYPYGEVGGMYGFIQGNSSLTGCLVNGTTIFAFGQDDKNAEIQGDGFFGYIAAGVLKGAGYYLVPGRHVSTLIGNIRATGTVTLTDCGVDPNTKCTKRHDMHNSDYKYIGQAYIVKFLDSEGSVTVNGTKLTLADCNRNTKR